MLTFITFIKVHEVLIFNEGAIFGRNQFGGRRGGGEYVWRNLVCVKYFIGLALIFRPFLHFAVEPYHNY